MELRINYDDDALTIMEKVNAALPNHLHFVTDDEEHDGFELYNLHDESGLEKKQTADDNEPAELREYAKTDRHARLRIGIVGVSRIGAYFSSIDNDYDELYLCDIENHGDVRRLCEALSIDPPELTKNGEKASIDENLA